MAPSPNQEHPKAPDKSSSAATSSKQNASETNQQQQQQQKPTAVDTAVDFNMTSTAGASGGGSTSCSGATQEVSSKNLKRMNDADFKVLLDEAFSYKSPKDREKKSETFRRLLDNVERNNDHQFPELIESRYQRGTNNQHGGSLQDLKESGANDILDTYTYGKNNRRQNHNSRTLKYSLVSTRQREGGSLPSNVNVYNCFLTEPKFLNEVGTKRRGKAERTFSGASSNSGQDSVVSYESKDDSILGDHTTITEIDISEDGSQGKDNPDDIEVGVEVFATMNLKTTLEISCPDTKSGSLGGVGGGSGHWVDDTVSFSSLERSRPNVNVDATTCALPFDDSSRSCQSVLGEKPEKPKTAIFQSSKAITPQVDENGNAIQSKKKKKFDADRNTTTVEITEVKGYRGNDPIETLVKFIENSETADSTKKSDKFSAVAGGGKKKDKKKEKDPKKDMHKMKKSTSLEELRSCTKLDEDDKSASGVIMRTKGKKNSGGNLATSPIEAKENLKQNTKRGERRSWGTEELTYLGENNAIEEVREKNKEKEKAVKKSMDKQLPLPPSLDRCDKLEKMPKKKKGERSLSVISMESAHSETAEFHVVTKKKRSKKRQSLDDARCTSGGKVPATFALKPTHPGQKKYQSSNSFSNDRDSYLTTYSPNESRRKSTSSVPPSEKSDSSDLDSVHSLPIESVSGRHQSGNNSNGSNSSSNGLSQMQSYADIARTVNASKNAALWQAASNNQREKELWPAVSAVSTISTISNTSTVMSISVAELCSNTIQASSATKQRSSSAKSKSLVKDFPDLVSDRNGNKVSSNYDAASTCSSSSSTSTIVRPINYSQTLSDEKIVPVDAKVVLAAAPIASTTKLTDVVRGSGENTKQTLQKSKSADNERFYSVEQYPALEKTVKRHSTQNPINDIRPVSTPTNGSGAVLAATQQMTLPANKQRVSTSTSSTFSQTQQQQSISTLSVHGGANVTPNTIIPGFGSTGAVAVVASSNDAIATTANSALSDTSKIVINNNLDMNTKIAATSSSSSDSLGNVTNSSTNSNILVTNNGKKSKANTKASSELPAPSTSIVDVNNAKNTSTTSSQAQTDYYGAVPAEEVVVQMPSANPKHLSTKCESQQVLQPTATNSGNPTNPRKSKKEKYHPASNDMRQTTSLPSSSHGKHSNRPAVIILNEVSDGAVYGGGDFTFGDFNEEELRLFDCNNHLDDSGNYNAMTGSDGNSSNSIVSENVPEDIHLSPHSDLGYSSSNNRSILSESMDQTNVSVSMGAGPPKMTSAELVNPNPTSHPLMADEHNDYKSSLPNDSAIIMASKNPSISTHFASSDLLSQSHATHVVPTKLFNTSSSSSSENKKVLSNNIAFSANHNLKYTKDTKSNEFAEHDSNVTNINSHNQESVNNNSSNIDNESSSSMDISSSVNNNGSMETLDNCTRSNYSRRSSASGGAINASSMMNQSGRSYSATASTATAPQKSSCDNTTIKRFRKDVNIRFIAPPITHDINSANYEKLVDFVGLAWEDIMHGVNGETEYYDGQ